MHQRRPACALLATIALLAAAPGGAEVPGDEPQALVETLHSA